MQPLKSVLDFNVKLPSGYGRIEVPKVLRPTEARTFEVYFTPRGDAGRNRQIFSVEPCYWLKLDDKDLVEWVGPRVGGSENRVSVTNPLSLGFAGNAVPIEPRLTPVATAGLAP